VRSLYESFGHQPNAPIRHIDIDGVIENEQPAPTFRLAVRDLFARR